MSPSRIFILRPVATSLLMVAILLAGIAAYGFLPVAALPTVDYPTIQVQTFYPGASPDVMTSSITAPLERQFGQMPGLSQMTSVSSAGASAITLQFSLNLGLDEAEQEVQAAINATGNLLPGDLPAPPIYAKVNSADAPLITLAVTSKTLPLTELENLSETNLAQKISQQPGVGLVSIGGGQRRAVRIQVDPRALAAFGLNIDDLRTTIGNVNVNTPKGNFDGPRQDFVIDANDQLRSVGDYRNVVVAYRNGAPVRLADVASIVSGPENTRLGAWANTTPAIILNIQRQPGANIIQVADRIKALLPQLESTLPSAVDVAVVSDRTTTVRASVMDIEFELMLAITLIVLVIFLFLRNLPATIIPSLSVPLSLVGTLAAMYLLGFSLDNLSLMALTVSTGFVVDDAIVMIENITRFVEKGEDPLSAALKGSQQIGFRPDVIGAKTDADLGSASGYAFQQCEPVISSHLENEGRFRTPQILAEHGIKRAINVPIVTMGEPYGVLEVDSPAVSRFTEADVTFVQGFANLLGVALERGWDEAALHETEERYRMASRATNDVIWDWDFASDRISWSEALATLFGYDEIETDPSWWKQRIHPDDRERVVASIEAVIASDRENWSAEYRFLRADGSEAYVFDRGFVRRDAQGRANRMIGSLLDQTERRRAEEARHRSEERLRGAFAISTVGVMFWSRDFALTEVNDALLHLTGFSREEVIGKTWQELTPDEFHPVSWRAVEEVNARGEATPYEKQYFRKDGSRWWGLFAPRKVGDEVVEFVLDITDRKEAEAALQHLNQKLESRVEGAIAERERAEAVLRQSQKLEAVGQLTGGVAHDFNNLLTIVRSSIDFLRRPNLPEERRTRYIEAISDTVDRASKLTGQLLAFARRQALKPEVFDVPERIRAIADMLRTIMGARIQIVTDLACAQCFVEADVTQFETALVNMAVNARDAMNGEGTLKVHVGALPNLPSIRGHAGGRGQYVAVSISDSGCGIPADRLGQIFEPFFTTKEVGKGTGLGLSQVYGFAKQSGGDVAVQSDVGVGTTFTLYLPRTGDVPMEIVDDRASVSDEEGRGCRVLVVEDNIEVGRFSTQLLQDLGYETTWVANASEALRLLEEDARRFDVVFSDVVMPGMSGVELARGIRQRYPRLPVVLTSGYSHVLAEEGRHGFELLHKPYAVDDVSRVLRRVTRGRDDSQAHAARSGNASEPT